MAMEPRSYWRFNIWSASCLAADDVSCCGQLRAGGGFLDRCGDDIGGQSEIGGLELISLFVRQGLQRFGLAAGAAEDIQDV